MTHYPNKQESAAKQILSHTHRHGEALWILDSVDWGYSCGLGLAVDWV